MNMISVWGENKCLHCQWINHLSQKKKKDFVLFQGEDFTSD